MTSSSLKMTNGSYELNWQSNLGNVNSDSNDMSGAFHTNEDNGNTFQMTSRNRESDSNQINASNTRSSGKSTKNTQGPTIFRFKITAVAESGVDVPIF